MATTAVVPLLLVVVAAAAVVVVVVVVAPMHHIPGSITPYGTYTTLSATKSFVSIATKPSLLLVLLPTKQPFLWEGEKRKSATLTHWTIWEILVTGASVVVLVIVFGGRKVLRYILMVRMVASC